MDPIAVHVCPIKDIECGRNPLFWCPVTCPLRQNPGDESMIKPIKPKPLSLGGPRPTLTLKRQPNAQYTVGAKRLALLGGAELWPIIDPNGATLAIVIGLRVSADDIVNLLNKGLALGVDA